MGFYGKRLSSSLISTCSCSPLGQSSESEVDLSASELTLQQEYWGQQGQEYEIVWQQKVLEESRQQFSTGARELKQLAASSGCAQKVGTEGQLQQQFMGMIIDNINIKLGHFINLYNRGSKLIFLCFDQLHRSEFRFQLQIYTLNVHFCKNLLLLSNYQPLHLKFRNAKGSGQQNKKYRN